MPTTTIDKGVNFSDSVNYGTGNGTDIAAQPSINSLPATAPEGTVEGFEKGRRARVISTNLVGSDNKSFSRQFNYFACRRSDIEMPVLIVTINLKPGERLKAYELVEMVDDYRHWMKLIDCPFLAVEHREKPHQHLHVIFSRVDFDGKLARDKFDRLEARRWARQMETKYNLSPTPERTQRRGMTSDEIDKYEHIGVLPHHVRLQNYIDAALPASAAEFVARLEEQNINVRFRFEKDKAVGISFLFEGKCTAGGKLGSDFAWSKLKSRGVDYQLARDHEKLVAAGFRATQKSDQNNGVKVDIEKQLELPVKDAVSMIEKMPKIVSSVEINRSLSRSPLYDNLPDSSASKSFVTDGQNIPEFTSEMPFRPLKFEPNKKEQSRGVFNSEFTSKTDARILQAALLTIFSNEAVPVVENETLSSKITSSEDVHKRYEAVQIEPKSQVAQVLVNSENHLADRSSNNNLIDQPLASFWWKVKAVADENKIQLNDSAYALVKQIWATSQTNESEMRSGIAQTPLPTILPTETARNLVRQCEAFGRQSPDFQHIVKQVSGEIAKAVSFDKDYVQFIAAAPENSSEKQMSASNPQTIAGNETASRSDNPKTEHFSQLIAEEIKARHEIRESQFQLKEWQRERKFQPVEIDRGEEEGVVSISIAELDKEARTLAKQSVEKLDKTGLLETQALEENKPHNEIVKRLFGQNYRTEIGKQTIERELINKSLEETASKMQLAIAGKETDWIRVAGETEKMKESLGKDAALIDAKLQPEEIWRLQEKAGFRLDEPGFFELEVLHREKQIPRSQEALARLRGVEKMADVTLQSENRAYEKLTQKHAGFICGEDEQMRVTVNLKTEDGKIKVTEMSLQYADEKIDKSNKNAQRLTEMSDNAGKQALKSLVSPFETQINPFSPVQGKLAWFTKPLETLNNHVNPLQIIKNDPGVQVIRAVYNYAKYTKQAFDYDAQAKNNLETAKDLTERVKPEITEAMSKVKSSYQDTSEAAGKVLQRTKDALDWEANIRAKEAILDEAYAANLTVPGKNMSVSNWKKFGDCAVELGDAELLKDFQSEMADTNFARAVGEIDSRMVARSIKADAQLATEARNAISQITKISPTEIQLEIKLSELIKFGEMDATAQTAADALENLGIKAGVAPLFSPQEELAMRGAMGNLETQTAANLSRVLDDPLSATESMENLSPMMAGKPAQLDFEAMNAGQQQVFEEANKIRAVLDEMANAGNVQSLLETQAQFQMENPVNQVTADAVATMPNTFTVNQPVMEMTNLERQTIQNLAEEIAQGELNDSYTEKELKEAVEMEVDAAEIVEEEDELELIKGMTAT